MQYVVIAHWVMGSPVSFVEREGALPAVTGLTDQMEYVILVTFKKDQE